MSHCNTVRTTSKYLQLSFRLSCEQGHLGHTYDEMRTRHLGYYSSWMESNQAPGDQVCQLYIEHGRYGLVPKAHSQSRLNGTFV